MKKAISILLIFSTMAISCATVDQTSSSTTRVMDVYGAGVLQHPVIGEMDVDIEKVTGTVERSGRVTNIEPLKVLAMNDAIKTAGADILVEPTFEIVSENSKTTVTVSGYPASYTNFRPITIDDVPSAGSGSTSESKCIRGAGAICARKLAFKESSIGSVWSVWFNSSVSYFSAVRRSYMLRNHLFFILITSMLF